MRMILYEKDWQYFPTAIADVKTRNISFLKTAMLFRKMGIRNHMFLLALVNPRLQGVDPYDPNLTLEQQAMIATECKINPWYFFREVARAPAVAGGEGSPFEANRANISLFWCFFNHVFYILIQPRQTGKSFSTDMLMTLLMRILCQNSQINLLTKDDSLRRANIKRLKDILDELPPYLRNKSKEDPNNGEEMGCTNLNNVYKTHVPQSSPKRALNMGRGLTSPIFHIDEPPFQPNIEIALPAALAAGGAAIDAAMKSGSPYGTIMTTTAGKKDDRDGRYVYNLMKEAAVWDEHFYDAGSQEQLYEMISANSSNGVIRINGTFDHRQLGKTDEWLKRKLEESVQKGEDANRDYFNIWTSGGLSSPFDAKMAEQISLSARSVQYSEISPIGSFILRWYIPESEIEIRSKTTHFVIGMDTSDASGGDDTSFVMLDAYTLDVVAAGKFNNSNLITFARWVTDVMVRFPNATLIPERRSTGGTICDYLLLMLPNHGIDPFRRIFNRVVNEQQDDPERFREIKSSTIRREELLIRYKKMFGFATAGAGTYSRDELYGRALRIATRYAANKVHDRELINQTLALETRNGRIDHPVGEHDDMVIAWLLAVWMIYCGTGLEYYGIDSRRLVNDNTERMKNMSTREILANERDQKFRARIEELSTLMGQERDESLLFRYERELRYIMTKITLEEGEIFSVDDMIRKAKEQRKMRHTSRPERPASFSGNVPTRRSDAMVHY